MDEGPREVAFDDEPVYLERRRAWVPVALVYLASAFVLVLAWQLDPAGFDLFELRSGSGRSRLWERNWENAFALFTLFAGPMAAGITRRVGYDRVVVFGLLACFPGVAILSDVAYLGVESELSVLVTALPASLGWGLLGGVFLAPICIFGGITGVWIGHTVYGPGDDADALSL